jgi:hypothetical protein
VTGGNWRRALPAGYCPPGIEKFFRKLLDKSSFICYNRNIKHIMQIGYQEINNRRRIRCSGDVAGISSVRAMYPFENISYSIILLKRRA